MVTANEGNHGSWERRIFLYLVIVGAVAIGTITWGFRVEVHSRADAINRSRFEISLDACLAQNQRHLDTTDKINDFYTKAEKGASAERISQLRASQAFTNAIIDTIAPFVENCEQAVRAKFR